jgi:PadR family transcriptional regulator PadR
VTAAPRIRLTKTMLAVLDVLLSAKPDDPVWGLRLCQDADLGSGTVYPLLERLERIGWIRGSWEDPAPVDRPRRRFYEVTGAGRQVAAAALAARSAARLRWLPGSAHPKGAV